MISNAQKKQIVSLLEPNGVVKAAIFGSYARGDNTRNSDIDILIKFKGRKSLLDLVSLEHALTKKLKRKVDLVTYNSIHHLLKKLILHDQQVIYDKKS